MSMVWATWWKSRLRAIRSGSCSPRPRRSRPVSRAKGSITIDGVSLTVNDVADEPDGTCHFSRQLIPHTAEVTTLGALAPGDAVNLEIDVLARYLQRMQSLRG